MKEHGQQHPERRALNRLVRDGVGRRVDVNEKQRGGRRGPRRWLYFLGAARGGEAIVAGARRCGVKDDPETVKRAYMRGGLKGRHTLVRNDFLIRLMLDAATEEGVEVPLEECWGEACPTYPLYGAKVVRDEAGRELEGRDRDRAGYERILPDGRFEVRWTDAVGGRPVEGTFDLEVEIWTRTAAVVDKIDARAAMFLRLLEDREAGERAAWRREAREISFEPRWLADDAMKARRETLDDRLEKEEPFPYFAGLGERAVPVVFLFEGADTACGMRDRVLRTEMPRLRALRERLSPFRVDPERLFIFAGLDLLLPHGPACPGRTLGDVYASLGRTEESLFSVANHRAGLLRRRGG